MEVKKENVLAAYEVAREAGADCVMKALEALFGAETFKPKDVTERIKTFEDARRELGSSHPLVEEYEAVTERVGGLSEDLIAYLQLRIVCAALNEGWSPEFSEDEVRWYPWLWLYTEEELSDKSDEWKRDRAFIDITGDYQSEYAGLAYAYSYDTPSNSDTHIGSRLCLKSKALARYCGKQFIRLWADFRLSRRSSSVD